MPQHSPKSLTSCQDPSSSQAGNGLADLGKVTQPRRELSLFDSICIIVGIIIGAGIYETTPKIAGCLPNTQWLLAVWIIGGLLSFLGALCYAELATAFPHSGGDYVFLTRAYGRHLGFLFAWCELWIVRPGSIGMMAFVFARYAREIVPINVAGSQQLSLLTYALGAIGVLTIINILGVRQGKWTQNFLTTLKILSLILIFAVGMFLLSPAKSPLADSPADKSPPLNLYLAMILVLFTYGGWNEMAYVAAEVKNPTRNILRALVLGTLSVTAIYVLVTLAFVRGLSFAGVQQSSVVASDLLRLAFGEWGGKLIAVIICISTLGVINGQIFTGARVYYAMGRDHSVFGLLGNWDPQRSTPIWSLVVQGIITMGLVAGFGWYQDGFNNLLNFTTPIFWTFFFLVGVSLFVLRAREPHVPRPYRVILFPVVPIAFCCSCCFMIYASVTYAIQNKTYEAIWAIAFLVLGFLVALIFVRSRQEVRESAVTAITPEV
ncbi:MAG TPA: amino acid permease [Thermogutta sp.]|nr:amino acid permease [Thermogutta sp.]HQF12818.1 amino acid permease [Thermogutta sp.]